MEVPDSILQIFDGHLFYLLNSLDIFCKMNIELVLASSHGFIMFSLILNNV